MAKKKSETASSKPEKTPAINFRCSPELKRDLEDLAHLSRRDVSSLLVEVATELVKANRPRITRFRQSAAVPIKMPFASSTCKTAAQDVKPASDEGSEDA